MKQAATRPVSTAARAALVTLLGLWAGPLPAHDTLSSWTFVRVQSDRLELTTKIAAEAVWPAVQIDAPEAVFEMERFEELRPLLVRCAKRLHDLRVGGTPLVPLGAEVKVVEDYLEFRVTYPRAAGAPLRLEALYLKKMSPEFEADVTVLDGAGQVLLSGTLVAERRELEVPLPSPAPLPPRKRPR